MATIAPLPPTAIRELLVQHGYKMIAKDQYNWVFAKDTDDTPVIVPYAVDLVPLEVARNVLARVGFDNYSEAIQQQADPWPLSPTDSKTAH